MTISLNQVQSFLFAPEAIVDQNGTSYSYDNFFPGGTPTSESITSIDSSPYQLILTTINNNAIPKSIIDPNNTKLIFGWLNSTEGTPAEIQDATAPSWFGNQDASWSGIYSLQYWNPAWLNYIESQIDIMISKGYNGVMLDCGAGDSQWLPGNSLGNTPNPNATKDLATFYAEIKAYVASKNLAQPFYIAVNDPSGIALNDPAGLKSFDIIAEENLNYQSTGLNAQGEAPTDPNSLSYIKSTLIPAFQSSGDLVLGNDYPPPGNLAQAFQTFSYYTALGIVPSVIDASDMPLTLVDGPYMAMAIAANPVVTGSPTMVNFLSGGLVSAATLIGGNQGDFFIGGPGTNVITAGSGNDVIYAHPATAGQANVVQITYSAQDINNSTPLLTVAANGVVLLAHAALSADPSGTTSYTLSINVASVGALSSLKLTATGFSYVSPTDFTNIHISSISYDGVPVALSTGTWSNSVDVPGLFNNNDTATFSASAFASSSPYLANTSDTINGGGGTNTVVYRDPYANYTVTPQSNGTLLVTSAATAEGPDTLTNIQHLQFTDGTLVRETAAQVAGELDTLQSIATGSGLIAIDLTDSGTPTLTITASQLSADAAAIKAISGSFSLSEAAPAASATIVGAANALGNTLVLSGAASDYTITSQGDGVHLNVSGNGASDTVSDIQALQFADHTDIVAATPGPANAVTTGNITELYSAVLAREPDLGGLTFYQNYLKSNPATPLQQFADYFLSSSEYVSAHDYAQSTAGDTQFIEDSYQNLLHRTPSADEVNFYLTNVMAKAEANLTPGTAAFASAQFQAHALMLVYFSASAEFLSDVQVTAANPTSAQHWLVLI
jgi:endo-alpha-1,4-polygalactosaminidase (GH114 family)